MKKKGNKIEKVLNWKIIKAIIDVMVITETPVEIKDKALKERKK